MEWSILLDAFFIAVLAWCSYVDIKKRTIPNAAICILLFLGLVYITLTILTGKAWGQYPAALLLGVPFFVVWQKNSIGAGDIKLLIATAFYLGLTNTLVAFVIMIPILFVLMVYFQIKNKTYRCSIPLAPVLSAGVTGAILLGYFYSMRGV